MQTCSRLLACALLVRLGRTRPACHSLGELCKQQHDYWTSCFSPLSNKFASSAAKSQSLEFRAFIFLSQQCELSYALLLHSQCLALPMSAAAFTETAGGPHVARACSPVQWTQTKLRIKFRCMLITLSGRTQTLTGPMLALGHMQPECA